MKLLADQDVYGVTTKWLRGKGHNKGFGALVFLRPENTPGVILVRGSPGTIEEVHRELECLLEEHKEEELKGLFCVVEPGRHRIRHLPGR